MFWLGAAGSSGLSPRIYLFNVCGRVKKNVAVIKIKSFTVIMNLLVDPLFLLDLETEKN